MKYFLLLISFLFISIAHAVPGCIGVVAETKEGRLPINATGDDKQRLILIENVSDAKLWVSLSPDAHTQIDIGNAAVIAQANNDVQLACVMIKPGSEAYVDCQGVVKACVFDNVDFGGNPEGTYWVAEDTRLDRVLITINTHGIRIDG